MKCVVTGGGGFVGKALAFKLRDLGHSVTSVSRGSYPELEIGGIHSIQADLSGDIDNFADAFRGAEAVFHVAAKVDMWGRYEDFFNANVVSAGNIIALCRAEQIPRLIYTSTPSVVADGTDLIGVDESYHYPKRYNAYYPQTKAIAERMVLDANSESLFTLALRPHLIWGPGDTNLVPTILERARAGRLVRVGKGKNLVDVTFIEDCVQAHIAALDALDKNRLCHGKAYFISQGEPVNLWDWINEILKRHDLAPVTRSIPKPLAHFLGGVFETVCPLIPGRPEPLFTRFLVSEMATSHYFDISAAKEDLGYEPQYSVQEALNKTFG